MKLKIKDGGPAFPSKMLVNRFATEETAQQLISADGMTLRDWFAGQAINAFILHVKSYSHESKWEDAAISSYVISDAMLIARTAPLGLED